MTLQHHQQLSCTDQHAVGDCSTSTGFIDHIQESIFNPIMMGHTIIIIIWYGKWGFTA